MSQAPACPTGSPTEGDAVQTIDKLAWIRIVDGRVLVARSHGKDAFYLPGGKPEPGESDVQALSREVLEELSVDLDLGTARHVLDHEAPAHGKPGTTVRLSCWEAEGEGLPQPCAEVAEIAWATGADRERLSAGARAVLDRLVADGQVRAEAAETRAVLFDLDDTLLVTREAKWAQSKRVARETYGFELTDAELEAAWGKPFPTMIAEQYRHSAPLEHMIAANDAQEKNFPKREVPGAVAMIRSLVMAGLTVGVVTSTRTQKAQLQLQALGFPEEDFLLVHGPEASDHHKPDGRVFDPALDLLAQRGIGPAQTVYAGDSAADRTAALGAGLDFVGIRSTLARDAAPDGHLSPVLETVADLPALLERRETRRGEGQRRESGSGTAGD